MKRFAPLALLASMACGATLEVDRGPFAVPRPAHALSADEAARYVLELVNRDRRRAGLAPVRWDPVAGVAARRHGEDLARHGFTAHVGTDGSVPEERQTEAGGTGLVLENVSCFADAVARRLDPAPSISPARLERIEAGFLDERPPNDGHRRNILGVRHTALGLAVVKVEGVDEPCLVQEFVDDYGTYLPIPKRARVGAKLRIAGELRAPAVIAGVALSRVDLPKPLEARELNLTEHYALPSPFIAFFPRGFKTPAVLEVDGAHFTVDAKLSDHDKPGLYGVSVWAIFPGSGALEMIGVRTVRVE